MSRRDSTTEDGANNLLQVDSESGDFIELPGGTVTAYQSSLFQRLRLRDGINFDQINRSLDPLRNRQAIFSSGEAAGASGSFFFFSHDRRFIVKTISSEEHKFLIRILPNLYRYFLEQPNSLIARPYGVFSIKMPGYNEVTLMLMANTLRFHKPENITRVYDIKGSSINRKVKNVSKSSTTLKDTNFLEN
jgi:hypothetical protein